MHPEARDITLAPDTHLTTYAPYKMARLRLLLMCSRLMYMLRG